MEYLKISQFAKAAGITKREAYKLWDKENAAGSNLATIQDLDKALSKDLLKNYIEQDTEHAAERDNGTHIEQSETADRTAISGGDTTIQFLMKQIEAKDEIIKSLREQNAELEKSLIASTEKALQIATQAQVLQLDQQTKKRHSIFGFLKNKRE